MLVPPHQKSGFSQKSTKNRRSLKLKPKLVKRGPRPNKKPLTKHVIFAGANINGAKSKWKSWKKVVKDTKATVFFVQETKCDQSNTLKMDGFIIFEKVRVNKGGGGVAIAAKTELNPVLLSEAGGDIDALTIDINTKKHKHCMHISLWSTKFSLSRNQDSVLELFVQCCFKCKKCRKGFYTTRRFKRHIRINHNSWG